jgi:drug/metabolite transporter (DMT)-like permease
MSGLSGASDHHVFALLYLGGAILATAPACVTADISRPDLNGARIATLLYLGIVPSGLGFFLWNVGARRTNPGTLAVMNNAKVPMAVACSLLVFGESARMPSLILGASAIVVATAISRRESGSCAGREAAGDS